MNTVSARGVTGLNKPFETLKIERRDVGPKDVLIDIKYAGICHSDVHHVLGEWQDETYPLVPGHEIAGIVKQVGSDVTKYRVGDRVGVGCMVDSCGDCENCKDDEEQFCLNGAVFTYAGTNKYGDGKPTQGGYSKQIVVTEDFVLKIPKGIELDEAAPLLCAGITTYSPLHHWQAGPGKNVAVIGLGGLGHMAVKIAHAMGAEVTVLSRTLDKKDDGLRLGADHYYATEDEATFKKLDKSFDLIINTISADVDLDQLLSLLKRNGTLVNLGAPGQPLSVNVFSLLGMRRRFAGSLIGGIQETQQMLDFCAEHKLGAEIEVVSADEIDKAYERIQNSDVRYRFVIDIATLQ